MMNDNILNYVPNDISLYRLRLSSVHYVNPIYSVYVIINYQIK
jgi:hypothetical protein